MLKLQAREIVRAAKRLHITLARGKVGNNNEACARGLVNYAVVGSFGGMYSEDLPGLIGRTYDDLEALEAGFEGYGSDHVFYKNRYYKVGKQIAQLAGLS